MSSNAIPWSSRVSERWGHHSPELLIASIGGAIVLGFDSPPGYTGIAASIGLMAFIIASWLVMRKHDRALCELCLRSMPLNPSDEAKRRQRRFWMAHTGSEKRFILPYMVVLIGSNFAPGLPGRIFWAVMQSSMIYLILSYSTHRRLQPWCPWCSDGGGGAEHKDDDPVTPEPDPVKKLQLT
ncbi:MAG TPA: hypothetical protein VKQ07_04140 [Jatrophihabitantaceae bacterium]|jgi:hypothetical protein|nr:hypothetical protein [Jatrophihabitantaceae bacterium]